MQLQFRLHNINMQCFDMSKIDVALYTMLHIYTHNLFHNVMSAVQTNVCASSLI